MTDQIDDSLIFEDKEWSILQHYGEYLFDPRAHGFTPLYTCTASWRGYFCTYEVVAGQLTLKTLDMFLSGLETHKAKYGKGPLLFNSLPTLGPHFDTVRYDNLHVPIDLTGGLLAGRSYKRIDDIDSDWARGIPSYIDVLDLTFCKSKVVGNENVSEDVLAMREWEIANYQHRAERPEEAYPELESPAWLLKYYSRD